MESIQQEAALTVWSDGSYQLWGAMDAEYAKGDSNYLLTIPVSEIVDGFAGPANLSPIKVRDTGFGDIDLIRIDDEPKHSDDLRPVAFTVRNTEVANRMAFAWNALYSRHRKIVNRI